MDTTFEDGRSLLKRRSRPLLNPDLGIVVFWSPRAACTTTYVWFCGISGLTEEMRSYDRWPHRHRKTYYQSDLYRRGLAARPETSKAIRILRDPYQRAISCFRAALGHGFFDGAMRGRLKIEEPEPVAYSFLDFLRHLKLVGLRDCNAHFWPQVHSAEVLFPSMTMVNITKSKLFDGLNGFERALGIPTTDFEAMDWLHRLEQNRRVTPERFRGGVDAASVRLDREASAGRKPWPASDDLLNGEARALIEELYEIDFRTYTNVL